MLDLGQVVDAIMIGEGGIVQFFNLSIVNAAPRNIPHTDTHARYRIRTFGPWPSISILPNATVSQACKFSCMAPLLSVFSPSMSFPSQDVGGLFSASSLPLGPRYGLHC